MNYVYKTHKQATQCKSKEHRNHRTINTPTHITVYKSIALKVKI